MGRTIRIALLTAVLAAVLAAAGPAAAAVLKPTRLNDPKPGACKPRDCSLREAVKRAKANDRVKLGKGVYKLARGKPLKLSGADLTGAGVRKTTVNGLGKTQVLQVTGSKRTIVSNLEITRAMGGDGTDGGAVLLNEAKATLRDIAITKSKTPFRGGAISSLSSNLTLSRATLSGNRAGTYGGGLLVTAGAQPSKTLIEQSTLDHNKAVLGGGIFIYGTGSSSASVDVRASNSTIAANAATQSGGGIYAFAGFTAVMRHVSVGFNRADSDDSGGEKGGGGGARPGRHARARQLGDRREQRRDREHRPTVLGIVPRRRRRSQLAGGLRELQRRSQSRHHADDRRSARRQRRPHQDPGAAIGEPGDRLRQPERLPWERSARQASRWGLRLGRLRARPLRSVSRAGRA